MVYYNIFNFFSFVIARDAEHNNKNAYLLIWMSETFKCTVRYICWEAWNVGGGISM